MTMMESPVRTSPIGMLFNITTLDKHVLTMFVNERDIDFNSLVLLKLQRGDGASR